MASVVSVEVPTSGTPEPLAELRPALEQLAEIVDRLHLRGGDVADALPNLMQRSAGRPATILMLGESEEAKSRFVRGLLGGSADSTPAPAAGSACTYFAYGREEECTVEMVHGLTARLPADQLSEFIAKTGLAGEIRHVLVRSPNPALKDGLVVIDSPPLTVDTEAFLRCTAKARAEADECVFVLEAGRLCGEATLRLLRALNGQCGSFPFVLESTDAQMEAGHTVELTLMVDALQRYGGIPRPSITVLSSAEIPPAVGSGRRRLPARTAEFHTALLAVACARRQESACAEAARIADEVLGQAEAALHTWKTSPLRRSKLRREMKPLQELRALTEALVARSSVFRRTAEAREDALEDREQTATRGKEIRIPGPPVADPIPIPTPVPPTADNSRVGPEAPQPVAPASSAAESLAPASDAAAGTACDTGLATTPNAGLGLSYDEPGQLHSAAPVAPFPGAETPTRASDVAASAGPDTGLGNESNTGLGLARDEPGPLGSNASVAAPELLHSDVPVAPLPDADTLTRASDVAASVGPDTVLGNEPNTDSRAAHNEATPLHSDAPVAAPEPLHSDVPVTPLPGAEAPTQVSDVAASTGPDTGLGIEPSTDSRSAHNEATPLHSAAPVAGPEPLHSAVPVAPLPSADTPTRVSDVAASTGPDTGLGIEPSTDSRSAHNEATPLHSAAPVAGPEPLHSAVPVAPLPSADTPTRASDVAAGTRPATGLGTEPSTDSRAAHKEATPLHSAVPVVAPEPLHSAVPVAPLPHADAPTRVSDVAASAGPNIGTEPNTDSRAPRNEAKPLYSDAPVAAPEPLHSLNRSTGPAPVARWEETGLQSAAPPPDRGASRRDPMRGRARWASSVEPAASPRRLLLEDLEPERASPIGFVLWLVGVVAVAACAWLFFFRPDIISNWTRPALRSQADSQAPDLQSPPGNLSAPLPSIDASSGDGALQAALARWVSSFRSRDINAQVACYSPHVRTYFHRRNVTREQILRDKTRDWSRIASIRKYTVTPLSTTNEGSDRRAILVRKQWDTITPRGTISSGADIERLTFRKLAGEWKIVDEQEIKVTKRQR